MPITWTNLPTCQLWKRSSSPSVWGNVVSFYHHNFSNLKKKTNLPLTWKLERRMGIRSKIPVHPLLSPHSCPQFPKQSQVSGSIKTILPHANCYCQAPWFYFLFSLLLSTALMEIVPTTLCGVKWDQWFQLDNLTITAGPYRLKSPIFDIELMS